MQHVQQTYLSGVLGLLLQHVHPTSVLNVEVDLDSNRGEQNY
jgi:hypothetical protein